MFGRSWESVEKMEDQDITFLLVQCSSLRRYFFTPLSHDDEYSNGLKLCLKIF